MLFHSSHFLSEEAVCIKLGSYSAQCSSICCQKCCAESHFSALKANYCHKNTKWALIPVIMYNVVTELCGKNKKISKLQKKKRKSHILVWDPLWFLSMHFSETLVHWFPVCFSYFFFLVGSQPYKSRPPPTYCTVRSLTVWCVFYTNLGSVFFFLTDLMFFEQYALV